jgi:serine/threonine-protein kinase
MKYRLFSVSNLIWLLALLFGAAMLYQIPPLVTIEKYLLTLRAGLIPVAEESPVVNVEVTEGELSRGTLAELVTRLSQQKVRAILLHLPLSSPAPKGPVQKISILRKEWGRSPEAGHSKLWQRINKELFFLESEFDGDMRLGKALREAGNVVLVAPVRTFGEVNGTSAQLQKLSLKLDVPGWTWQQQLKNFSYPFSSLESVVHIRAVQTPLEELRSKAAAIGFIASGNQGVPAGALLLPVGERYFPSAVLGVLMVSRNTSIKSLGLESRKPSTVLLSTGNHRYLIDHRLSLLPMPAALLADVAKVSASDIFAGVHNPSLLEGKVAIVGLFAQPQAQEYSNALLVSQMLGDFQLSRPGWLPLFEVLVLFYFAVFLWLAVPRLPGHTALILMGLSVLVWLAVATILLINIGWWFQLTPPLLLTGLGLLLLHFARRRRERLETLSKLHCSLGKMLQEKGMLDKALENYQACSPNDATARDLIYNLGLDFERKRQFGQALRAYDYLAQSGRYKDISARREHLRQNGGGIVSLGRQNMEATMVLEKGAVHPTLGRYEIVRELGQGAMGTVYLGRDPKINREVAIKTLAYSGIEDSQLPMVKERFFREAEAAGRLNHPGIVTIFDAGEEHDLAYLAMEFLCGENLSVYCKPNALLPVAEVMGIIADIAEALAYAHGNDVVHRDIKPANIMRQPDGSVKVTDFGIARVVSDSQTQTGMILGTPSYMSPEQVSGKKIDGRSDLFSLGSVCYELLCGEKPFIGDSIASLMYNISNVRYTPLSEKRKGLPMCSHDLVDMMIVKAVSRRPKNAAIVAAAAHACREKVRN